MKKTSLYLFLFLLLTGFSYKLQPGYEAYNLKAAFIYNFTKFIEWDRSILEKEFIIGIVGTCPINETLAQIARTNTAIGKNIVIRRFNNPEEIRFCHMLFIPLNTTVPLQDILEKTTKGTLTISEKDGYARQGTAINFVIIKNKLKFEANIKAINSSGLKASSQLLKLAINVTQN